MKQYYSDNKKFDKIDKTKKSKTEKTPFDFIINTLKILQNKIPIPEGFLKNEIYKYPFQILSNLSKQEKNNTLNQIKSEYDKYFSEEYEIAKQFWNSMNFITFFLNDESKKNLLNNEDIMSLLDNYKSEEEMNEIETEIKKNMNSPQEDNQFWRDAYELLKYLKHKKLMEDLYNNFINNQRINHKLDIINEEDDENNNNNENEKNKKIKNKKNNYIDDVDDVEDVDKCNDYD